DILLVVVSLRGSSFGGGVPL
ncbi:hypothetical protein A2U01_0109277, partial [Trifolium medium]|nr:hypothetical protein [Trifolium medium]